MKAPVVSGAYTTQVGTLPGRGTMSILVEAGLGAVRDAQLEIEDIDGLLCGYSISEPHPMLGSWYAEYLGIRPSFVAAVQAGGATACVLAMQAAALVQAGTCRHVLVVTGENRLSGLKRDNAVASLADFGHPEFERPYGFFIPAAYALIAQRYMHEYGTTSEQLAAVAVTHRAHAARHPKAHMRSPITADDVLQSRPIATPLHLLDCCLISDGGAAIVVSSGDCARDLAQRPVALLGAGQGHTHEHIVSAPDVAEFGCRRSAEAAMGQAGVSARDIKVALLYDSFTITFIVELEAIGFCARGESGHAAMRGELSIGGRLPCNTHGGLLSFGHSGAAGAMFHIVEAVAQLRGEAAERQVAGCDTALVHGCGGVLSAHCSLVLGRS